MPYQWQTVCTQNVCKSYQQTTLVGQGLNYGKCSKISNTLKLQTPKIIAENNFQNILKNRTLTFLEK